MAARNSTAAQMPAVRPGDNFPAVSTGEISTRFMEKVIREYGSTIGVPDLSGYQKRLIQSYFIGIDRALAEAEVRRADKKPNDLPVIWKNVNTPALFIDVVNCVKLGLDMSQPNHVYAIPYYNNRLNLYDVTLMQGYAGIAYIAAKYAADPPVNVITQLVCSSDTFKPHMRDAGNGVEAYEFEITNPFDRGEIVGGFGYIEYADPQKNRLVLMSRAEMDKRKPAYASGKFWGKWDDEMYLKTLVRHVYSERFIPRDPMKLDDAYQRMKLREVQYAALEAEAEISANANKGAVLDTPKRTASSLPPEIPSTRPETAQTPAPPAFTPAPPEPAMSLAADLNTGEVAETGNGGSGEISEEPDF